MHAGNSNPTYPNQLLNYSTADYALRAGTLHSATDSSPWNQTPEGSIVTYDLIQNLDQLKWHKALDEMWGHPVHSSKMPTQHWTTTYNAIPHLSAPE